MLPRQIADANTSLTGEAHPRKGAVSCRMSKVALNPEYPTGNIPGCPRCFSTVHDMINTIDESTIADTGRLLYYDGQTEPW